MAADPGLLQPETRTVMSQCQCQAATPRLSLTVRPGGIGPASLRLSGLPLAVCLSGYRVALDSEATKPGPLPGLPAVFGRGHRDSVRVTGVRVLAVGSSLRAAPISGPGPGRPGPAARLGVGAGHAPAGRCVLALTGTGRQRQRAACARSVCGMRASGLVPSCRAQALITVTVMIPRRSASAGAEVGCTSGGLPLAASESSSSPKRRPIKKGIGGK